MCSLLIQREDLGRLQIDNTSSALADSLIDSCKRLESFGARNFLILTIPPLEHSPKYNLPNETGILSHELIGKSTRTFNRYLSSKADAWESEDGDRNIMLFDLETFWRIVLDSPELFGMTECARYSLFIGDSRMNVGRMGFWCVYRAGIS